MPTSQQSAPSTKTQEAQKPSREHAAIKDRVMPLLLAAHNVAALGKARQVEKVAGLEAFVDRAIERGLTMKHVDENLALGRPPHWIETGESG